MSSEETTDGRKSYVRDAFWYAKMIANTYLEWQPDENKLKPLQEDANRIADGTWDTYHRNVTSYLILLSKLWLKWVTVHLRDI